MSFLLYDKDYNPICQSCALPMMHKDFFGTNKDNTLNYEYCILCYRQGEYTDRDITMERMIFHSSRIFAHMKEMPLEKAEMLIGMRMPRLKRWAEQSGFKKNTMIFRVETRIDRKWNLLEEKANNLVVNLIGKGDFLFARRITSGFNYVKDRLKKLREDDYGNFDIDELLDGLESITVLFNLCMDKGLIFEKEFYDIKGDIDLVKSLIRAERKN